MKHTKILINLLLFIASTAHAATIIQGNDSNTPYGFSQLVQAETFNRKTGVFFVGLTAGAGAYAISKVNRPTLKSTPQFTGIATQMNPTVAAFNNSVIHLDHLPQNDGRTLLAYVLDSDTTDSMVNTTKKINVVLDDGQGDKPSDNLNDANGDTTEGIETIATNNAYVFAAVRPNGGDFGNTNSGIALVNVTRDGNSITLTEKDATTGLDGNLARRLDLSSTEITGGTNDVTFNDNFVAMYWDSVLERLYIGVNVQSAGAGTDIAMAIVAAHIVDGRLDLIQIVDENAITTSAEDEIIVTKGSSLSVSAKHLRVMHTTTGPSYLIVNGGNEGPNATGNTVFALPLVDKSDPDDVEQGTLADINAFNPTTFKFDIAASAPGDLATDTQPFSIVGTCTLPIEANNTIEDMVVIDDTVYVSIAGEPDDSNDVGIFFSQALFDDEGAIVRWTPWKRALPKNAFPGIKLPGSATHDGAVTFFEVDATTGNITFVEGTTERVVGITSWTTQSGNTNGLINTLNTALSKGSYSFLDLDQSTNIFLSTNSDVIDRYALFGGVDKVVFARTAQAVDANCDSPQTVITDFDTTENFLSTDLPSPGGCVQALEFSRTASVGYFFAGTENGLFVFNINGNAFDTSTLAELDQPPFSNGSWTHIEGIEGSVIDLKTSGLALYILTRKNQTQLAQSCDNPLESMLYTVSFNDGDTVADSFDESNIHLIATSATTPPTELGNTILFSGIQIISTGDSTSNTDAPKKEQLILATNQGLFGSDADQSGSLRGIPDAINQTEADWQIISNTNTKWYNFIGGINTPIKHTVWPVSIEDEKNCMTFDRAAVHQLSSADNMLNEENLPPFVPGSATIEPICSAFNAKGSPAKFTTFDPITYFWSDGARRFFIFNRTFDAPDQTKLGVNPWNVDEWNVNKPQILTHPTLNKIKRFYWIQVIGSNGLIMAGTEQGVVGLE